MTDLIFLLGKFLLRYGRRSLTGVRQEVHFEQPVQEATLVDYLQTLEF